MAEILPKNNSNPISSQEENLLNWSELLEKFQITFGKDIYDSWIKNINLKKEFNHYIILSAPTRFVRDWIVSRYADKILDVIQTYKKTIQRIEFLIEESEENIDRTNVKKYNQM